MENTYHLSQVPGYIPRILKAFPMTVEILSLSLLFSLVTVSYTHLTLPTNSRV